MKRFSYRNFQISLQDCPLLLIAQALSLLYLLYDFLEFEVHCECLIGNTWKEQIVFRSENNPKNTKNPCSLINETLVCELELDWIWRSKGIVMVLVHKDLRKVSRKSQDKPSKNYFWQITIVLMYLQRVKANYIEVIPKILILMIPSSKTYSKKMLMTLSIWKPALWEQDLQQKFKARQQQCTICLADFIYTTYLYFFKSLNSYLGFS